jgi:hypothetical protein
VRGWTRNGRDGRLPAACGAKLAGGDACLVAGGAVHGRRGGKPGGELAAGGAAGAARERAGLSAAALGLLAALAADASEITSAATALSRGQASVGAGVVTGSNVFNLAALLGLSALVAGRVRFHRRVILLGGIPGIWIAMACLLTVAQVLPPAGGLAVAALALAPLRRAARGAPVPRRAPAAAGCLGGLAGLRRGAGRRGRGERHHGAGGHRPRP